MEPKQKAENFYIPGLLLHLASSTGIKEFYYNKSYMLGIQFQWCRLSEKGKRKEGLLDKLNGYDPESLSKLMLGNESE